MRICLYTATAFPKLGGQESVVDALARHLLRLGHEPTVLAPRPRSPLRARDQELPYPVRRHPRFISTRRFTAGYRVFLDRLHARVGFDVIHCHDVYPTGYIASRVERAGVPLVITSHGGDVRENNPRLERGDIPRRCRTAVASADALVSIAPFTERGFLRLGADPAKIISIPNGIDLEPYDAEADSSIQSDGAIRPGEYFLFLGRLARRKGVDLLLEAFAGIPAEANVQLIIAGDGDERPALEVRTRELNLADRVRFGGRVEGRAKIQLLRGAIAVVMPSREWEAFPLVVLESFAAGRPILGTNVPGIADLVDPGRTGLLTGDGDVQALAAALHRAIRDREEIDRMGRAARQVARNFSWESVTARHVELYTRLIQSANQQQPRGRDD